MSPAGIRPNLVLFDCDGVLIESEIIACRVDSEQLSAAGFAITPLEVAERFIGLTYREMLETLEREHDRSMPEEMYQRIRDAVSAEFDRSLEPVPHASEVARAVDDLGIAKCVASSSGHDRLRHTLGLTNLWDLFEPHVFSGVDVPHGKPAPDLFLAAAAQMDVAPEDCLVIEDSVAGVRAGVAAGMQVIAFHGAAHCTPSHPKRLRDAGAPTLIDDLRELIPLLGQPLDPSP